MSKTTGHDQLHDKQFKTLSDEQLMSQFNDLNDVHNQRAFEMLYSRHKGPFYRFISKSINNQQDVNELYQDWWFKIIKNKHRFDSDKKFTTWAYTIARRLLIDHFRKSSHAVDSRDPKQEIEVLKDAALKQPENEFEAKQMSKKISIAIEELPIAQRQTFMLYHDGGLTLKEVAEITGHAYEKTKSQYRYAVQKVKSALELFK